MQKVSKMVDMDVLLRKTRDKLTIFPLILKVGLRGAVPSLLDGHDVLAVLDSVRICFAKPL